jgi:hypothetical protein
MTAYLWNRCCAICGRSGLFEHTVPPRTSGSIPRALISTTLDSDCSSARNCIVLGFVVFNNEPNADHVVHLLRRLASRREILLLWPRMEFEDLADVPDVRSKALYTTAEKVRQPAISDDPGEDGALSLLLNKPVTFRTIISRHFFHCLTFLSNNLFDFSPCDVLQLLCSCGLRLGSLLLFRLGLRLEFYLLAALWLCAHPLWGQQVAAN